MAQFNAAKGNYEPKEFDLLPTDIYRMKIVRADIQQNTFGEQKEDGTYPEQLVLTWEVSQTIGEQDQGVVGLSVWQRMAPWYGDTKRGPSKFKEFVDSLITQNLLDDSIDPSSMDTDWFVGIEQRATVELYKKTMGANKGQDGNKIVSILPLIAQKRAPVKVAPVTAVNSGKPALPQRPTAKNVPQPVTAGDTEDDGEDVPF